MIALLHGYLLEGSGSNLWTRSIISSLCRQGETVHLFCQENHPEIYDFISEFRFYALDGTTEVKWQRDNGLQGQCIMHKVQLGDTLPVYVRDNYEEFSNPVPMIELADDIIEDYLVKNAQVVEQVVRAEGIQAIHANHTVLMPEVARRVKRATGVSYVVMPHGSAIEYAVKKDQRFFNFAKMGLAESDGVFVIGKEIRARVNTLFAQNIPDIDDRMQDLNLGVDTSLFKTCVTSEKPGQVQKMLTRLEVGDQGKSPELYQKMIAQLNPDCSLAELKEILATASKYHHKSPDQDIATKLSNWDWEQERCMLFVGRFIAGKGLQAILMSLVDVLQQTDKKVRILAVGHGPQREVLETLVWALQHGHQSLVETIVAYGKDLEQGGDSGAYAELDHFLKNMAESERKEWFERAQNVIDESSLVFTGYLTHDFLKDIFPCADVGIFPSVVAEAGPLVFLEALACGVFPLGTYFAGMAASIDSTVPFLGEKLSDSMKLRVGAEHLVEDIANSTIEVLSWDSIPGEQLRKIAVEKYDWSSITQRMSQYLLK